MTMKKLINSLAVILWIMLIGLLIVIFVLSFMDGDSAKNIDNMLIRRLAVWYYNRDDFNIFEIADINYRFRQYGRIALFLALGVIGTLTIHCTFYWWPWVFRGIISGGMLMAVAVLTEKYKEFLPTRHFSKEEMMMSITGAAVGFIGVSVMTLVFSIIKRIIDLIMDND